MRVVTKKHSITCALRISNTNAPHLSTLSHNGTAADGVK